MDKRENQIQYYAKNHEKYPERLREIPNPPEGIYVIGKLPDEKKPSIAIVGARNASWYGRKVAFLFAQTLAVNGVQIISGLARGIDTAGHEGALQENQSTYGILGNGVDICYPKENQEVYNKIIKTGGLISEILPGTNPQPRFFPMRNRIISAFADIVLVVEAKERSGALITADMALEQGKDVYAVPGRITDELSDGCNRLIAQGAGIAISPEYIVKELNGVTVNMRKVCEQKDLILATEEKSVYSCIGLQPKHMNEILTENTFNIGQLVSILFSLELKGVIKETTKNYYVRV